MFLDFGKKIKLISPIKKKMERDIMIKSQIILIETLKNLLYKKKYSIDGANRQLSKEILSVNEREQIINDLKKIISEIKKII